MYDPIIIANFFIKKSLDTGQPLTPMKLLKLVYISHGWYLGLTGHELINERVQAWQYGPVIPSVYHAVKPWGKSNIDKILNIQNYNEISDSDKEFLNKIWDTYANFNGLQLSSLTHQQGTPWYITYHNNGEVRSSAPIPNDVIKDHYQKKANVNREIANG